MFKQTVRNPKKSRRHLQIVKDRSSSPISKEFNDGGGSPRMKSLDARTSLERMKGNVPACQR